MNTLKIIKRHWIFTIPFVCVFTALLLGKWTLSAGEEAIPSMIKVVIDDFSRESKDAKGNLRWILVVGKTGDNTISNVEFAQDAGRSFLHVEKLVSPRRNYAAYTAQLFRLELLRRSH